MKKFTSIVLCVVMVLGCMAFSISAADNPDYLYNRSEYYSAIQPRGDYEPSPPDVVLLPEGSGSFDYSFANKTIQYSDFIISPQTPTTGIRMSFEATSASHNVSIKVIRLDTDEAVYSGTLSMLKGFEQEFWLSFTYLEPYCGYYIELTNPSISNASGTFTITG